MAKRVDKARFEVAPVRGGYRLQRFDARGRKLAPVRKVFTRRNNCRREAIRILRAEKRTIPIVSLGL